MSTRQGVLNSVAKLLGQSESSAHPGLILDRLMPVPEEQKHTGNVLPLVLNAKGGRDYFPKLLARRDMLLASARRFTRATGAPMSLHLARAGILENAGICLHGTYGFAHIPGSGLKGMARAYAETIWLPLQKDEETGRKAIDQVFGWGDTPDRKKMIVPKEHAKVPDSSGLVVFHDAWPTKWPELEKDVLTSHHPKYYGDKRGEHAPGDWEDPIPVNFLAVTAGTSFEFAVSSRGNANEELLDIAAQFLDGALIHLGAGAKTNAGYGIFLSGKDGKATSPSASRCAIYDVKLITPAFLAGSRQDGTDCELRGATLRGLFRSWWRTMHAAHLSPKQMQKLETALWGSSMQGGAIAIRLQANHDGQQVAEFNRTAMIQARDGKNAEIEYRSKSTPKFPDRATNLAKVTPGLTYVTYGMWDGDKRRHAMLPGATWTLRLEVRDAPLFDGKGDALRTMGTIPASVVLSEARHALWLLAQYGGVGSKGRKGFGSLECIEHREGGGTVTLDSCKKSASATREVAKVQWSGMFSAAGKTDTAALEQIITFQQDIETTWKNPWGAMHLIGFSLALFGAIHAHDPGKGALGLPRKKKPEDGSIRKDTRVGDRFSSPWHLSLHRGDTGFLVRFIAFPNPQVPLDPSCEKSRTWLDGLREHLEVDLKRRVSAGMKAPDLQIAGQIHSPTPGGGAPVGPLKAGDIVSAILLAEKTKKNGWKAEIPGRDKSVGSIVNTGDVPADAKAGDEVKLLLNSDQPAYKWPRPEDLLPKAATPIGKHPPRGPHGGGGGRR